MKNDLCKCDLQFAKHGLRGPLVDQDLCKFTQICVNLHISPRQNTKICVNVQMRFAICVFDLLHFVIFRATAFLVALLGSRHHCASSHVCVVVSI